jgi:hypothetical protein
MTEGPGSRPEEAEGNPRLALLLAMAMFVPVVDTSLMNVSISSVVHNLDSSRSRWVGFAFLTTGMVVLIPIVPRADSGWDLVVPMLIAGSGLGLLVSQLNNYTLSPISEERVSEAAGVNSAAGSFGLSFGLAFVAQVALLIPSSPASSGYSTRTA